LALVRKTVTVLAILMSLMLSSRLNNHLEKDLGVLENNWKALSL